VLAWWGEKINSHLPLLEGFNGYVFSEDATLNVLFTRIKKVTLMNKSQKEREALLLMTASKRGGACHTLRKGETPFGEKQKKKLQTGLNRRIKEENMERESTVRKKRGTPSEHEESLYRIRGKRRSLGAKKRNEQIGKQDGGDFRGAPEKKTLFKGHIAIHKSQRKRIVI